MTEINFICKEYMGNEIYFYDQENPGPLKIINNEQDLKEGMQILARCLGGYRLMTVGRICNGISSASNESHYTSLEFGKDDRNAWVAGWMVNKYAIKKLTLNK